MSAERSPRARPTPVEIVQTPPHTVAGHALADQQFREAVGAVDFAVVARYAWDTGVAVSAFLRGLREGRILARECRGCRRLLVPPRMFCEECFRPTDRWVEVGDTGRVNTYSICRISWNLDPLEEPELPAVIEIDGATAGMGFLHKLGEVEPADVRVGMEVEAVWRPAGEREGSILDIAYFRPRDASLRRPGRGPGGRRAGGEAKGETKGEPGGGV